jgi:hypothetical protein
MGKRKSFGDYPELLRPALRVGIGSRTAAFFWIGAWYVESSVVQYTLW